MRSADRDRARMILGAVAILGNGQALPASDSCRYPSEIFLSASPCIFVFIFGSIVLDSNTESR